MLALVLLLRPQKLAETQVLHLDLEFKKVRLFVEWRVINRSAFVTRHESTTDHTHRFRTAVATAVRYMSSLLRGLGGGQYPRV